MSLQNHVTSLELSKKLFEIGIKQESFFCWEYYNDQCHGIKYCPYAVVPTPYNNYKIYSAPTASELMILLPAHILISEKEPFNGFRFNLFRSIIVEDGETITPTFIVNYNCDTCETVGENAFLARRLFDKNIWDKTLPNVLAKVLIYLKENNLDKPITII
jgi:hypothetical protein